MGVAGVFMVRCYFSRVSLGVPIFSAVGVVLPVVLRVQLSPMLVLTLFFIWDLSGAYAIIEGSQTRINHWSHVGGYLLGLAVGYATGLYRDGAREGLAARAAEGSRDGNFGRSRNAREALLELEPDHVDALLSRARQRSRFSLSEAARTDYRRVIQLLVDRDRSRATDVFLESFRKYLTPVEIDQQLVLAPVLADRGEYDVAARCLELAAAEPCVDRDTRATALLYQAKLLVEMGLPEAAEMVYEQLIRSEPECPLAEIAAARLEKLGGAGGSGTRIP